MDSDVTILDVLRSRLQTVTQLSDVLSVTGTVVRQRLTRLLASGYIERTRYDLNVVVVPSVCVDNQGACRSGQNFADLAIALWDGPSNPDVCQGLMQRVSRRLAEMYTDQVQGEDMSQRLNALADLFADRRFAIRVDLSGELPVLNVEACPYPEIAEYDRSVCSMEKMLFSEILGESVGWPNAVWMVPATVLLR